MIKGKKQFLLLGASFLMLIILASQWILVSRTAKKNENIFEEKTKIVLARSTEEISSDSALCIRLKSGFWKENKAKIDSIIEQNRNYYDFHEPYTYTIVNIDRREDMMPGKESYFVQNDTMNKPCYDKSLESLNHYNNWELHILYPYKKSFILNEMIVPFLISVIIVLFVVIFLWKTYTSLIKEKRVSEQATEFLNNMTHELKTPLTNISLAGRMIMKDAISKSESDIVENMKIILDENDKLTKQIEKSLSITALEQGEIPLEYFDTDIHDLINELLPSANLKIASIGGKLEIQLGAKNIVLPIDKVHFTNVIQSIIENSVKYSKSKLELLIRTYNTAESIVIEFIDNGIGIDEKYLDKVFVKFFRVPNGNIHSVKGFGLGLSYVKKIIEMHKGSVIIESKIDKGTKVKITLPNV